MTGISPNTLDSTRIRVQRLEKLAVSGLEPDTGVRRALAIRAVDYGESFLEALPQMQTFSADKGGSEPLDQPFGEAGVELESLLKLLDDAVIAEGINAASGGHMGYIPGGGVYPAAIGDFLADVTNRYSGVSFASPGSARIEQRLVEWMSDLVGYPEGAGGDLTSGGSIANLTAIIAARETMGIRARDVETACIYMTEDTHHCVDKSLRAAGLSDCPLRRVGMDAGFRMDAVELETLVRADIAAGLKPWLIIASAGTTDTGAVDPVDTIADIAERFDLWLHVDAAYGGFFLLCKEGRAVLKGLEKTHSIVLDPHKGMFLPYGSGAVLVRDVEWLARSQAYEADYMQDATAVAVNYSPADLSLELSRPFRGMRFWLPLKLFGLAPFRAALSEKIWLARYFYEQLGHRQGWELGPFPELSVVIFRYIPAKGDADEFNQWLSERVMQDGKVFISSTRVSGAFMLRLAVLHFRTHLEHVDYLLALLQQIVDEANVTGVLTLVE
jgi:glutamate/tyrosine decarboxylase-like PLP-dependent enzyme